MHNFDLTYPEKLLMTKAVAKIANLQLAHIVGIDKNFTLLTNRT